jgi:hypothetical protein
MKRRAFVAGLSGVAAAWPVVARGQQDRVRTLGVLLPGAKTKPLT